MFGLKLLYWSNCHILRCSLCFVPDILFHFIPAGGRLRLEVKECNPRMERKTSG